MSSSRVCKKERPESVFNMCDCVNVAVADMSTNFAYLHMLSVSRLVDS